jgi:hypothetical protein
MSLKHRGEHLPRRRGLCVGRQYGLSNSGISDISIALNKGQVAHVVGMAAREDGLATLQVALTHRSFAASLQPLIDDLGEVSRIVVRALLVLTSFPADGTKREVTAVAKRLGLSISATHRYAATWVAVGLLERDGDSRQYGRVPLS